MLLRFSVTTPAAPLPEHSPRGPRTAGMVDVELDVPTGSTIGTVADELRGLAGADGGLFVGGCAVSEDALLGVAPLVEGAVVTVGAPGVVGHVPGLLLLQVESGPDAGALVGLEPGPSRIGRALGVEVRLDDPDCSRVHAVIHVGWDGASVRDLGSTNGTSVDGVDVGHDAVPLLLDARLRVGASTLVLAAPSGTPATVHGDGVGRLAVNRPPRIEPALAVTEVHLPSPPRLRDRQRFPLVAVLLPLVAALVVAGVLRQPAYLLFGLLSPLLLGGQWLADRSSGARTGRQEAATYADQLAAAHRRVAEAVDDEAAALRARRPSAAALARLAAGPCVGLWERRPADEDALLLRLGTGDRPAGVQVHAPPSAHLAATTPPGVDVPLLVDVPLAVALTEHGVLGVAAPRDRLLAMARWLLVQLAVLHSPRSLDLVLLVARPPDDAVDDWAWSQWLPHLSDRPAGGARARIGVDDEQVAARVAELVALLDARQEQHVVPRAWTGSRTVVLLDGARRLRSVPGVARVLAEGPAVGLHAVCLEDQPAALPAECRARALVCGDAGTELRIDVVGEPPQLGAVPDGVSVRYAERVARQLAPLRDATPDDGAVTLPTSARLLDVLMGRADTSPPTAGQVAEGWRRSRRSTRAVLGVGVDGPVVVDLQRDGPHALVAGTTGSGKSELLQTLVASLALANRPDELGLVLVDYKGGAAFAGCAGLPHTLGLVTDLDEHLTRRALDSLTAELERRERVLAGAGASDLPTYQATGAVPTMPRLVIVVDEFATLAQELPEFVHGLVGIAMRGRSLGVHLVLATQRPAGAVSADIRANIGLRIALRVADVADSVDVLGSRAAAAISRTTPGRAYARRGAEPLVPFQTARVTGGRAPSAEARVTPVPFARLGDPGSEEGVIDDVGGCDLAAVVAATRGATVALDVPAVPSPWLAPLPEVLVVDDLPAVDTGSLVAALPYGLADLPAEQARCSVVLDLERGRNLLVVGAPRTGRSTLLRTIAAGVAKSTSAGDVHVYGIDCGGGALAPVAALPHCGAVTGVDQPDRVDRLLQRLQDEVRQRVAALAAGGYADLAEQRALGDPTKGPPYLLMLVDRWEGFLAGLDELDGGRLTDTLLALLREGPAAGLRVVVTADRSGLLGRLSSAVEDKVVLRLGDRSEYGLAGLSAADVPLDLPPGRGVVAADGTELQIALPGPDPSGPGQVAHLRRLAAAATPAPHGRGPFRVAELPTTLAYAEVGTAPRPVARWALVGVGGDEAVPMGLDLSAADPLVVVAGPPRSGRSTALMAMARSLLEAGSRVALVAPRASPLRDLRDAEGVVGLVSAVDDATTLASWTAGAPSPLVVVVDDVELLVDTATGAALEGYLRATRDTGDALVLGGTTAELLASFRGLAAEARKARSGVLLSPSSILDGDLLGVRLPRSLLGRGPRGRGVLVVDGEVVPVQVPMHDPVGQWQVVLATT